MTTEFNWALNQPFERGAPLGKINRGAWLEVLGRILRNLTIDVNGQKLLLIFGKDKVTPEALASFFECLRINVKLLDEKQISEKEMPRVGSNLLVSEENSPGRMKP